MSEQFDSIMEGLDELTEYAKGDKSKARSRIREVPTRESEETEEKIMTLKEILNEADFKDIWPYLIHEYDNHDNDNSLAAYFEVFEKLKHIEPAKSNTKIRINYYEGHGWDVGGINEEGTWAIEFRPWNEWLGMELDEATLSSLKPHEIAAHCLWEMTFIDYDEDTIQGELCGLKEMVAEFKTEMDVDGNA